MCVSGVCICVCVCIRGPGVTSHPMLSIINPYMNNSNRQIVMDLVLMTDLEGKSYPHLLLHYGADDLLTGIHLLHQQAGLLNLWYRGISSHTVVPFGDCLATISGLGWVRHTLNAPIRIYNLIMRIIKYSVSGKAGSHGLFEGIYGKGSVSVNIGMVVLCINVHRQIVCPHKICFRNP